MTHILLDWEGPFDLVSGREEFKPPGQPGIYLWTLADSPNSFRISYVGESGNIRNRLYQHAHSILGGAYWLFETPEAQRLGKFGNKAYKPGDFLTKFLNDFSHYADMAYRNLAAYHFFWANVNGDQALRRAVEDLIIVAAGQKKDPVQNNVEQAQLKIREDLVVKSQFYNSVEIPALRDPVTASEIDPE